MVNFSFIMLKSCFKYAFLQLIVLIVVQPLCCAVAPPPNDDPCSAIPLTVNTNCTLNTYTNDSATNTTGVSNPTCGFYMGGDVWFSIVVPSSGAVQIQTASLVINDGACAAYLGNCGGVLTEIGCDDDGGVILMPQLTLNGLTPGDSLFIRFWEYGNDNNGTFQICVIDLCPGGGPPYNDEPCNAQVIQPGVYTQGNITLCATGINEPTSPPLCWNNGVINSVWYKIVAIASSMRIRCNPVTLSDPQIAVYEGTCGTNLVEIDCNDNGPTCGLFSPFSDVIVSGLIAGNTYYIAVDGVLDEVGSFNLLVIDGNLPLPPIPGQDCGLFQPICAPSFTVGNPGFSGIGNICDFNGANICLVNGERSSAWYEFSILSNGAVEFSIVPNDWFGAPSLVSTDYDFAVWKTAGAGAVTCSNIEAGAIPLRCNFSGLGVTGIYSSSNGVSPLAYPGFGAAFQSKINVVAGEKYALVISNYTVSNSGFNLNFSATSPIAYGIGSNATVFWSGAIDSDWFKPDNWGGCIIPDCSTNAVIGVALVNQPIIIGNDASCNSLTISPAASLTLKAPHALSICGDYVNNGSLSAQSGSIIKFNNGNVFQNISGNLIGNNALSSLQIHKTGSNVQLNQDLDLKNNLNIDTLTSAIDVSDKAVKIGGDFFNFGSYTNAVNGNLEFNSVGSQVYYNTGLIGNVNMKHLGSGLTLLSDMTLNPLAKLSLDSGVIITDTFKVNLLNRNPNSISTGNNQSYIVGNLKRYVNPNGSYNFPLSTASQGLQLLNIDFAYPSFPNSVDYILGKFKQHSFVPSPLGVSDCGINFSNNGLDNGYWSLTSNIDSGSGQFDLTLYNQNYTNAGSSNGWTIMNNNGSGWLIGSGSCVPSTVNAVRRLGMQNWSSFSTAQSPGNPLPVTWLYFRANPNTNKINLDWATASETNNSGFEIYKSTDEINFVKIGWVKGKGNSNVVTKYNFQDLYVKPAVNYYFKLRQIDYNGNFDESKVVTAKLENDKFVIYPNPVVSESVVTFFTESKLIKLDILMPTGELVKTILNGINEIGNQSYLLNPESLSLASGYYLLRLQSDKEVAYKSFCYFRESH